MDAETTLRNVDQPASPATSRFEVGQILDGKFEILSLLGRGGMGSVYRAKHLLLNMEVALKTLDTERLNDVTSSRRFQTEAKAAFSLKHPNLVKVHDFGVLENGHPFLVMDLVQGKTLQAMIKERGHFSVEEIEPVFAQLCFGLAYAHRQQVVHRDIKPANIMVVDGMDWKEEGSVKILDFGIAKIVNEDRNEMDALTQTGEIFGSPLYMSPEQCAGETIDQRSDIYSLGCVLFEAITGTPPLVGTNPLRTMMLHVNEKAPTLKEATLGSQFSPAVEQIIAKLLAKSPADRYCDLGVVALELHKACTSTSFKVEGAETEADAFVSIRTKGTVILSRTQLVSVLAFTSIVSICSTLGVTDYLRGQAEAAAMKKDVQIKEYWHGESEVEKSGREHSLKQIALHKTAFEKVSKITAIPFKDDNGILKRKVVFPELRMGATRHGAPDIEGTRGISKEPATKERIFPASGPIIFNVNKSIDMFALPNFFVYDKIDPELFCGLDYEDVGYKNSDLVIATTISPDVGPGVAHLFEVITKWKNLEFVNFRDVEITKAMLSALNNCPKLTFLVLHTKDYDSVLVSQQPFLKRLDRLTLIHGNASPILKALSHSHSIKKLVLGDHSTVDVDATTSLRKCSHIDLLVYGQYKYDDDRIIRALSSLRNVSRVSFINGALSAGQLAILKESWVSVPAHQEHMQDFVPRTKPH